MILSGRWIVPISSPPIENGAIVVENDRILDLGPLELIQLRYPHRSHRKFESSALLPGFVNVHSHLELTILRGYLEGLDFWRWIRTLTRAKYEVLNRDNLLHSAILGAIEAIRSGVTTVADPMDIGTSLEAILQTGLRGVVYQEVFSPRPEEADEALESLTRKLAGLEAQLLRQTKRRGRVTLGISPHAPYTVSAPLFQKVRALAKSKRLPTCIHLAESAAETQFLQDGTGPIGDSFRERGITWDPPGCTPVEYLNRLGILDPSLLLVHCIRLTPADYSVLRERGIGVAHCPKSNWKLGHGYMKLKQMRQQGIRVGLGSDSVASNNTMDLFEEMRFAMANPSFLEHDTFPEADERPSAADALRLACLGGAEALGLADQIGSIEKGKQADIIAVGLGKPHLLPVFSPAATLVYSAKASDVHFTMVAGEVLFDEGRIDPFSESELAGPIEEAREKLRNASNPN
jgi:5-methylthioadenosine/S-adenosylhomocysteine deaminase